MAVTNITLCNRALTRIGAPVISSFDDGSREAEVLSELYDHVYEALLTETSWNFAVKDIELSRDVETPTDENWTYQYLIPSDYLNLVYFYVPGGIRTRNYARQGDYVLSSDTRLFIKYTYKPSENELPPWFANYLIVKLAHDCTEPLIAIGSVQDRLAQEFMLARRTAYKMDNNENPQTDALAPSNYVRVRF